MNIRTKITAMGVGLVLFTAIFIVGVAVYQKGVIRSKVDDVITQQAMDETAKVAQSVYLMCQAMYESVSQTVANNLKVAEDVISRMGPVTFADETATWQVVNQYTKQSQTVVLPRMLVGGQWLGQNYQKAAATPVVDKVKELVGGTCTVFQRMNAEGDMLRVATNVEKMDGSRAIGTFIPHTNPDGTANPVIAAVLRGETFTGRAYVVNAWYITAYQPIWDVRHEQVIGVLYFGEKQENVASLRKGIMNAVVGKTGYVFVVGAQGDQKGVYLVSKDGARDGENIYDARDADGRYFIRSIVEKALAQKFDNEVIPISFEQYGWQNEGELQPRAKIAAITYFAPWDWVIGATLYEDDMQAARGQVEKGLGDMVRWILILAAMIVVVATAAGYLLARSISNPLKKTIAMIKDLERGHLDSRLNLRRKDEIGQIATAMDDFAANLQDEVLAAFQKLAMGDFTFEARGVIGQPLAQANAALVEVMTQGQMVAVQIAEASAQVSDASQSLSQGATESAASLEEISASMTELASQTRLNAENAEQASRLSASTREAASQGGQLMTELVKAMEAIDKSSADISKINRVINDIAFQTNLLALNAAVEAARAGQHGKGFAVVAEEVRNLAARSAKAAEETASLIEDGLDKTRNGSGLAARTATALEEIASAANKAADIICEIAASSNEQSEGIAQINQGLGQIDQVTQQNTASSEESAAAAEELAGQAAYLRQMLEKFRLKKEGSKQQASFSAAHSGRDGDNKLVEWDERG